MLRALLTLVAIVLRSILALFRSREDQAIVELALRQQLAVYIHKHPRPRLSPLYRAFWVALSRVWPRWRSALVLVQPQTVVRWHRKAFRGYWRWISKPGPGRPPIPEEVKALIVQMAQDNGWRARKIREELAKLGIHLGRSLSGSQSSEAADQESVRLVSVRAEFAAVLFADRCQDDGEIVLRHDGSQCVKGGPTRDC